jgi:hypothetical protein
VKASVKFSGKGKGIDVSFFNLDNVSNSSPCSTSLTNWVIKLKRDQVLISTRKVEESNLFCQLDGGLKGQEVRLFRLLDESNKSKSENGVIYQFWVDLTYTGKTSDKVAAGTNQSLKNLAIRISNSMAAAVTLVLELPSPTQMPAPRLGSGTSKACPTHAVPMISNLCFVLQ